MLSCLFILCTCSYLLQTVQSSLEPGVVIKSFSEIMAEKRKRRLEMQQAQKAGGVDVSSTTPSSTVPLSTLSSSTSVSQLATSSQREMSYARMVDAKPRVPVMPIVFASGKHSFI